MISPCRLVVVDVDLVCGGNLTLGTTLSLFLLSITFSSHQRLCLLSNGNTLMVGIGIFPEKDPANPSSSMMKFVFIWLLQVTACPTCLAWGLRTQKLDRLVESPEADVNYQE